MNEMKITELVQRTMEAMQQMGLNNYTNWSEHSHTFRPIIKMHIEQDTDTFSREIITEYVKMIEARFDRREISLFTYQNQIRSVQRLTEVHDTGKLEWSAPKRTSKFVLNEYYDEILEAFVPGEDVSFKTKRDITWIGKKYFSWLICEDHSDLSTVGVNEVQGFMIYCSKHMSSNSIHDVKLYMKRLYAYLTKNGYSKTNYDGLLSFPTSRYSKLNPAIPKEEIISTLEIIDKRTPQGKRDYAMILLACVIGLRAIDVAKIRLKDIDWEKGEIRIVQSKTKNSVSLPLTKSVGEAISDYILNARPSNEFENIFLKIRPPFRPFADGVAISYVYNSYRKKAGLPRNAMTEKVFIL